MKRKIYGQIAGICLAVSAALSLCACGGDDRESENENAALAKEHVYSFQEIPMPGFDGDEYDICASAYRNGTISLLVKVTDWDDYNENDIRILSLADDGSDTATSRLETVRWNPAGEDSDGQENSWYDNYTFGADGRIYAVRNVSGASLDPEGDAGTAGHCLCCWAADGTLLWETALEAFPSDDEYVYTSAISVTPDGTAHVILTGAHAYQISVDAWGGSSGFQQLSDETCQTFSRSAAIVHDAEGSLLLVCYGEEDWTEQYLISYDPVTDTAGEACRMPSSLGWDGYSAVTAGSGSGLLYSNRTGICSFPSGDAGNDTDDVEKMNFINSDINVSSFDALISLSDTSFAGVFHEAYGREATMGIFTYTAPENVPDRAVLVLDGSYISNEVMQRVVEFNRSSDQYRIVVRHVEEYDSEEEFAAGMREINIRILSGDMPDILITDGLPVETYGAKGLLADIGTLIKEDKELSQVDFLQNVFNAYSVDGKLYYVIPRFKVGTMIGAASTVGDRTSWNFADAQQLLKSLPDGTNLIAEADRTSFLQTAMAYCGSEFVDVESGKCHFQSQDFLAIMEYAKSLPEAVDEASYDEDYWRNYEAQFKEGRTILTGMPVYDFRDINYYVNDIFGEEAAYIGFPTADGTGAYVRAEEAYAISAHSNHIEGAWEFLRYYLTEEYQANPDGGLPVQSRAFLESANAALRESSDALTDSQSATLKPLTGEQMDRLVNFILSVDRRYYYNEEVMNIVDEEAAAFFAGDKTAQEAAEIIQSRVQLYLDENS